MDANRFQAFHRRRGISAIGGLLLCLCAAFAFPRPSVALQAEAGPGVTPEKIEEYRAQGIPADQWPVLLESLGVEDQAGAVRALIRDQKPFPAAPLAAMLSNPKLAVRLGALDLLEEAAQETFGFDPWQENPEAGGNGAALAQWKAWSEKGGAAPSAATLDDDTFRALATELMSGDRDRMERASERLLSFGMTAIAHLEAFLAGHADLEAGARAALKAAEYRIVLQPVLPKQAAGLARELALGSGDAQSTALAGIADGTSAVLPIISDFLSAADPLVREAAVDAAFKAGKEDAAPMIVENLPAEKAESVQHAMLRGLGTYASKDEQLAAIVPFTNAASENIVISALEALGSALARISASDTPTTHRREPATGAGAEWKEDYAAKNPPKAPGSATLAPLPAIVARLSDARWRVRVAALQALPHGTAPDEDDTAPKANAAPSTALSGWQAKAADMLHDPDRFVRVTAVSALRAITPELADTILLAEFKKQNDLKPAILEGFLSGETAPPAELWEELKKAPPEVLLECLNGLESRHDEEGENVVYASAFTKNPNADVAACALRLLATHGRQTAFLLEALKSPDPQMQDAVLDTLNLPADFLGRSESIATPAASPNPVLDRLYELLPGLAEPKAPNAAATQMVRRGGYMRKPKLAESQASPTEMRAVLNRFLAEGSPRQRFRAAVVLASQGDATAAEALLARVGTLSSLDRRMIAGAIEGDAIWPPALAELAADLLRDPEDDVREKALEAWLTSKRPERLPGLLAEFSRPGTLLHPDDIYGWELNGMINQESTHPVILDWARHTLDGSETREDRKVLAIVLLGATHQYTEGGVERFLDAPQVWLRRAANRALGPRGLASRLEKLCSDDSPMVRAVVPFLAAPESSAWRHWFDDAHSAEDAEDLDEHRNGEREFGAWAKPAKAAATAEAKAEPGAPEDVIPTLQKLARDPSDAVRFEAQFALLRLGHPIDPGAFVQLLAAQPEDTNAKHRLAEYLEQNFARLGKSYASLVPLVEINESELEKIRAHFGIEKETAPATFAALVKNAPALPPAPDIAIAAEETAPAQRSPFHVVFFYKPGCRDCERVRDMLDRQASGLPLMLLEERNVEDAHDALFNEALSARFHLRDVSHQVAPAVFTQAGVLVRDEITYPRLGELLRRAGGLVPDSKWLRTGATEIAAAKTTITTRYAALSLGVVTAAGLLDGINPCAFATIVFLLSYLQVARRKPGEILAVGASFIVAVFLAYLLIGMGLARVLASISGFRLAGMIVTWALAGFALVVAMLSFHDAQLASHGQYTAMALQLPGTMKERIRGTIRANARAEHFVAAAFVTGIVVSFLSLSCTGQVYLPTIQYMLHSGHAGATGQLVLYNAAFVVPLIVVFIFAWTGLRSEVLARFQQRHIPLVKVLTGVFFLLLAGFLLFGTQIFPQLGGN